MVNYFLYESSSGYALFERLESEEIGSKLADVVAAATDLTKFGKVVKLKSFAPFKSAAHALENMNDVSEGTLWWTVAFTTVYCSVCLSRSRLLAYLFIQLTMCIVLSVLVYLALSTNPDTRITDPFTPTQHQLQPP